MIDALVLGLFVVVPLAIGATITVGAPIGGGILASYLTLWVVAPLLPK